MALDVNGYLALAALLAILGEWTYVIVWTRTVGSKLAGRILRAVLGLRTGRGKNPTVPEAIADAADAEEAGGEPDLGEMLDSPIAKRLMAKVAAQTGMSVSEVRKWATHFVGEEGSGGATQGAFAMNDGSEPPQGPNIGGLIGAALSGVISGKIPLEDAVGQLAPLAINYMMRNAQRGGGGGAPTAHAAGDW